MKSFESTRGHGERGFALIAMALFILAFLGLTAIAVEISRLTDTATEVQASADSAALGGAAALAKGLSEVTGGQNAATANSADGHAVATSSVLIEKGHYDSSAAANPHFSTSCTAGLDCNAVKATVTVDNVSYIMASILEGHSGTNVLKNAVAALECQGTGYPLPMAVSKGVLDTISHDNTCGTTTASFFADPASSNSACWTSLGSSSASASFFRGIFPAQCGGTPLQAYLQEPIHLQNGVDSNVWKTLQCCIACQGVHDFTVVVIDNADVAGCTSGNAPVLGFATIRIALASDVNPPGGGPTNCNSFSPWGCATTVTGTGLTGITAGQVCKSDVRGSPGGTSCTNFGNTVTVLGQLP